ETSDPGTLMITGPTGLGKTHLAVATARECRTPRLMFAYLPALVDMLREYTDEAFLRATTCDLLVLDDLGAERESAFGQEKLEHLVNVRWSERRPMIITKNRSLNAMTKTLGEPLIRRLVSATRIAVELDGDYHERAAGV
ncbi:MAG: ATP-binding protein, partial [Gammaproteobacteria bacterium]|nr:ATP-binding protein [Gammaproteobacteria bacterium]NIR86019.1 ATP-binding protein [Gammaproteobacteria bacterium]NIU07260.1 ATP-binding protein [Gammaproteobacteria bacterium]NIV54065.1 ATP-binding protein [Gammaproteobacteria bacterium]NIX88533.1 ATP-binding protein [Gammaproteobacteria bacterium]